MDEAELDLVERLIMARRSIMVPMVPEIANIEMLQPPPITPQCLEHPGVLIEYWCEEDKMAVCHQCMIFGRHRGHHASKSRKRLDTGEDFLAEQTLSLQTQLEMIEQAENQYREECGVMKDKAIRLLEEMCEEQTNLMAPQVSNQKERLQLALQDIQSSHDSGTSMEFIPVRVTMVPSMVERQGTRLVIENPVVKIEDGKRVTDEDRRSSTDTKTPSSTTTMCTDSSSSVRSTRSGLSRPEHQNTISPLQGETQSFHKLESSTQGCRGTPTSQDFKKLDLAQLDGAEVVTFSGGTPGQFFCRQYNKDTEYQVARLDRLLDMSFESRITPLIPGECVLARWDGVWHRATVVEAMMTGWKCNLVDLGKVVTVATLEISDLPTSLLEIPVMAVSCHLVGMTVKETSEELMMDWEKLVKNKKFTIKVVNKVSHIVNLFTGDVSLTDRLRFLGYLSSEQREDIRAQYFSQLESLSAAAYLCAEYAQISPDNILLYFDNPSLDHQLKLLQQVSDRKDVEGPPGDVQPGHAVLAPWQGKLYRAVVERTLGTDLTVFFVDFGNTDTVSWWDCFLVPTDMLFPPLATMVRLAGVRAEERGSWTRDSRDRLREVLNENNMGLKLGVRVVKKCSSVDEFIEVELTTACGKNAYDVLVEEGYACGREEDTDDGDAVKNNKGETVTPVEIKSEVSPKDDCSVESFDNEDNETCESKCDEIMFSNNRVYLTGCLPQHSLTELALCTWAEELWGQVNSINIGYNQVIIDFRDFETAQFCSKSGQTYYGNIPVQIFSSQLRTSNGVLVHQLDPMTRRSDLLHTFHKFGDIAYTEGPFSLSRSGFKAGVVVFKDSNSVVKVLGNWEIKLKDMKLRVERYSKSRLCKEVTVCSSTSNLTTDVAAPAHTEEVEVVKIESPDQVWIRPMSDKERWEQLHQAVQAVSQGVVHGKHHVKVGDKVVCKVPHLGVWYRASVLEVNKDTCRLKLVDLADVVTVDTHNISLLQDPELRKEKVCVKSIRLGRLEPAGSGGWSGSAVDFLLRRIGRRRVFLVRNDDGSDDLVVEEVIADNPTDVESVSRESFSDMLLERGLALKINTRSRCAKSWSTCIGSERT